MRRTMFSKTAVVIFSFALVSAMSPGRVHAAPATASNTYNDCKLRFKFNEETSDGYVFQMKDPHNRADWDNCCIDNTFKPLTYINNYEASCYGVMYPRFRLFDHTVIGSVSNYNLGVRKTEDYPNTTDYISNTKDDGGDDLIQINKCGDGTDMLEIYIDLNGHSVQAKSIPRSN
eukprot:Nk52_evm24s289 gene=Nk52_evmTU24s289